MVLSDFLDDNTHPMELIVIRDENDDSVVQTIWTGENNTYRIMSHIIAADVISNEWRTITAVDQNGNRTEVPCHYIDI